METVVEGSYHLLSKPKLRESTYFRFSNEQSTGQEIVLTRILLQSLSSYTLKNIFLEPVYIETDTNSLVYNSKIMEKGKKYHVIWDDKRFMLIKEDDGISIYRAEEEKIES